MIGMMQATPWSAGLAALALATTVALGVVGVVAAAGAVAMAGAALWTAGRRTRRVRCALDLEATQEHFHAHVALEGAEPEPGDEVLVHDAPSRIPLGTRRRFESTATLREAGWLERAWVRLTGGTAFHELYDVGFEG